MTPIVPPLAFAMPDGPALALRLQPRLESWERRDHPAQVALREFVAHVHELIDPRHRADGWRFGIPTRRGSAGRHRSAVGARSGQLLVPDRAHAAGARRLRVVHEVSRCPIAGPRRAGDPGWRAFAVPRSPGSGAAWKSAVRRAVESADELPEGPVGLQLGVTVGPTRRWTKLWKPSIDGLDAVLGRAYPDRDWNPLDGRIVRPGLHRSTDAGLANDVAMVIWARSADEEWSELGWLNSMSETDRTTFFDQHGWRRRRKPATRRTTSVAPSVERTAGAS